jgi:hypothetical protein
VLESTRLGLGLEEAAAFVRGLPVLVDPVELVCLGDMDHKSLERWQAERLRDAIRPKLAYVRRLRRRMERRGFPGTDKLCELVRRAEDDLQALFVTCRARAGWRGKRSEGTCVLSRAVDGLAAPS